MGVRTPFYFVICVDDQEQDLDPEPMPVMDADLYNYYFDEDEVDHDDGVYSIGGASSCCNDDEDDEESLLEDIDSVYGDDDGCDFDLDFPSFSKREILEQYLTSSHEDNYNNDYEDDEYTLPPEEWEETINDVRQELDETPALALEKRSRRRYGRRETASPPEVL